MAAKITRKRTKRAKKTTVSLVKIATQHRDRVTHTLATLHQNPQRNFQRSTWRTMAGETIKFQGIQVFAPVDPYKTTQRKEFKSAMTNPYVYRASRIQATMTVGHGYTTTIVPRSEEEVPDDQLENWEKTTQLQVEYFGNDPVTPERIKDKVDKMAVDMDLATNMFNAYMTAIEQGRCVLALTPLETDDNGNFSMPEQIRLIRPEFTERPVLDDNTGELAGVRIIGVRSPTKDNILPTGRMIYVMHGFNNELFSDFYGDSKVSRVSDEANTLNIVLNQDYERAAEHTWWKPPIFSVPIPPQEFGNEDAVLTAFLEAANESKGQSSAVTGPSNPDEQGVTVLNTPINADISGLEIIRTGLIKAIITAYGLPGFMLSEGDIGKLGGNANIEEVDSYLNTEIKPERTILENIVEKQFFDNILAIMFQQSDARKLPVKIKIKFNKPKLLTLVTPDMLEVMAGLTQLGMIEPSGLREIIGLEEADKETVSKGAQGGNTPGVNTSWADTRQPVQINLWHNPAGKLRATAANWGNIDRWNEIGDKTRKDKVQLEWENEMLKREESKSGSPL